ncbi:hypothetical protein U1Q18_009458 [Sarracenia purpurea var. burkii]
MDPKLMKLGSSLPVPIVQELAKEPLKVVPNKYVRPDQDHPIVFDTVYLPQIPIIDLQKLLFGDDHLNSELQKLHHACKDWGFFQLINHGVSSSLVEKVKVDVQEFFKLPLEEKKKFYQEPGDVEGYGQAFVVSEDQKLDWADMLYLYTLPVHLRKPHLLPKLPLPLRDTIESYSKEIKALSLKILGRMAKALKMTEEEMIELFDGEGLQSIRMNYYPPCPQPELAIGLSPHSDGSGITIVLQLNEIEGLQIKKDGHWVPVTPLPDAFIVNIGDVLEVSGFRDYKLNLYQIINYREGDKWPKFTHQLVPPFFFQLMSSKIEFTIVTNGIYRSIEHRATVNSEQERISIAVFVSPRIDGHLGPTPSLITPNTPALFKTSNVVEFYRRFFNRELRGKSFVDGERIQSEVKEKDN